VWGQIYREMRYLQSYKIFESNQDGVTPQQRNLLNASCQQYRMGNEMILPQNAWWVNPDTGLIDVGGGFGLPIQGKGEGLLGIKFGTIGCHSLGYFNIIGAGLEDASELPRKITGSIRADDNRFRTLEGIGFVEGKVFLEGNLLVSLEGVTRDFVAESNIPPFKFLSLAKNPMRGGFLVDDLDNVLQGEETWTEIYLSIVAGDYDLHKDKDESIEWIIQNKLGPKVLEEEIRKSPERMAIQLAKVEPKYRKLIDDNLSQIDLPPGFREDKDLLADLGSIGL